VPRRQLETGAGAVGQGCGDGETSLEHGPKDRPGTRDKDGETHDANLVGTGSGPERRGAPERRSAAVAEVTNRCHFKVRWAPSADE
jgi:hypothetical protein